MKMRVDRWLAGRQQTRTASNNEEQKSHRRSHWYGQSRKEFAFTNTYTVTQDRREATHCRPSPGALTLRARTRFAVPVGE
jgi:hypothetical protein